MINKQINEIRKSIQDWACKLATWMRNLTGKIRFLKKKRNVEKTVARIISRTISRITKNIKLN
jgi:hypothetical protein